MKMLAEPRSITSTVGESTPRFSSTRIVAGDASGNRLHDVNRAGRAKIMPSVTDHVHGGGSR